MLGVPSLSSALRCGDRGPGFRWAAAGRLLPADAVFGAVAEEGPSRWAGREDEEVDVGEGLEAAAVSRDFEWLWGSGVGWFVDGRGGSAVAWARCGALCGFDACSPSGLAAVAAAANGSELPLPLLSSSPSSSPSVDASSSVLSVFFWCFSHAGPRRSTWLFLAPAGAAAASPSSEEVESDSDEAGELTAGLRGAPRSAVPVMSACPAGACNPSP